MWTEIDNRLQFAAIEKDGQVSSAFIFKELAFEGDDLVLLSKLYFDGVDNDGATIFPTNSTEQYAKDVAKKTIERAGWSIIG